ncbi:TetR family transcriptional regulator C-terminal domain-containing protein [Marinomonas sp. THO17]|uniref:acrylate utilization transcriptional regulator AcuR n=1 Tax=Marinomonas sp. THO17 TaxID=3149048 RepID=UPI00336C1744
MPELSKTSSRGRPKKTSSQGEQTRQALLHAGVALLTEKGFINSGIEPILKIVGVPKGSFYHYFASKEAFGLHVLDSYQEYFENKLDHFLLNESLSCVDRLRAFAQDASQGMAKYNYQRGCLVGNLEQESTQLSAAFNLKIQACYQSWQDRLANCLLTGQSRGEWQLQQEAQSLAQIFWLGWEGAVHRARLLVSSQPLESFMDFFINSLRD